MTSATDRQSAAGLRGYGRAPGQGAHYGDDRRDHPPPSTRRGWWTVAVLCLAQFMLILDITVVNVALPSIQADLGIAMRDLQWVVTAYTLAFGGLLLLGGRAADLFGKRRMFLAGLGLFTAASLVAAVAGSAGVLLAARAGQGIAAALLSPAALSLVTGVFPAGPARHRALATWAAVAAGGGAAGVLIGGVLTAAFGWQAIFLVNVPVGVGLVAASRWLVPAGVPGRPGKLDLPGALLASLGLVALVYGLTRAESSGWVSGQTLGLFGLAAAALVGFVLVERRSQHPLVTLSLFRRRPITAGLVLMVLGMGPVFSGFFFASLYLQQVLGHSALRTGVEFLPVAVLIVIGAHLGGWLVSRWGARSVIAAGMALNVVGALLLSRLPVNGSYFGDLLPGFLVLGLGAGLAISGVMITVMSGAGDIYSGMTAGLASTAHELSIALSLPVLSTIAAAQLGAAAGLHQAGAQALTDGIGLAYLGAAGMGLAGVVLALLCLRRADTPAGDLHHLPAH